MELTFALVARDDSDAIYGYQPSEAAALAFGSLFAALLLAHVFLLARYRSWWMIPFVIGVGGETAGYFFRWWSATRPTSPGPYIGTALPIILAPAFLAASHYTTFGRLITYVGEEYSPVRARWVTRIFVTFDVLSFVVQAVGGGSSDDGTANFAKKVLIVGFSIQIVAFSVFLVFAGMYHHRALSAGEAQGGWVRCLQTMYVGGALIIVRSIYRTIEFGTAEGDTTGFLVQHEAIYYVLEAAPILVCCAIFVVSYPGRYIPKDRKARWGDGVLVAEGEVGGAEDKREWGLSLPSLRR